MCVAQLGLWDRIRAAGLALPAGGSNRNSAVPYHRALPRLRLKKPPGDQIMTGELDILEGDFAELPPTERAEVEFIMSALDAAGFNLDRRRSVRNRYRVRAALELFSEMDGSSQAIILYTRDATSKSLGFITRRRLPLGYGGVLEVCGPDGVLRSVECTLLRCREISTGWYEGALYFNREQPAFRWD
jgi:hypothetical protein